MAIGLTATFASLRHRNFRQYFFARALSNVGTWVQIIAENWLVLRLSHSGIALGISAALQFAPILILGLYAGVVVDRVGRRRVLLITQSAAGCLALATAALIAGGVVTVWIIWAAALLLGIITSFNNPAQEAFTKELVGGDDLGNAIALSSAVTTASRLIGPAIGGLVIGLAGLAACFVINGVTFAAVVVALAFLDTSRLDTSVTVGRSGRQVREGLAYVARERTLAATIILLSVVFTVAYNFQVLLPLVADRQLHGGGGTYGQLMSALGGGALVGALVGASRPAAGLRSIGLWALVLAGAQAMLGVAPNLWWAMAVAVVLGFGSGLFNIAANSTMQHASLEEMRGRVMAMYSMAFLGTGAIGGPLMGWIAQATSAAWALGASAVICLLSGLIAIVLATGAG